MKKVFLIFVLLFTLVLSSCDFEKSKQRIYLIDNPDRIGNTDVLIERDLEKECFVLNATNIEYGTKFEFNFRIDFIDIDGFLFYDVNKNKEFLLTDDYILKGDVCIEASYENLSEEYKSRIKKGDYYLEFLGVSFYMMNK